MQFYRWVIILSVPPKWASGIKKQSKYSNWAQKARRIGKPVGH